MSGLSHNPARRRIICLLDREAYLELSGRDLAHLERSNDLQVLNVLELHLSEDQLVQSLRDGGLLVANSVLVQNPYRHDTYADAREAAKAFAVEKAHVFSRLCQLLGATSVKVEEFARSSRSTDREAEASAGYEVVKVGGGAGDSLSQLEEDVLDLSDVYAGGPPFVEKAREYLEACGLPDDQDLSSLVDSFEHLENPLTERTLSISLTRESRRTMEAWAEIGIERLPTRMRAKYKAAEHMTREIRARYRINF